jgi:hypothetical protein
MPNNGLVAGIPWVHFFAGIVLLASPLVFGYIEVRPATVSDWVGGILLLLLAMSSVLAPRPLQAWVILVVSIWLVASPFVLAFTGLAAAMWTTILIGVVAGMGAVVQLVVISRGTEVATGYGSPR